MAVACGKCEPCTRVFMGIGRRKLDKAIESKDKQRRENTV